MTADHQEAVRQGWNVKLRLAIDADNADEARAIAAEVWRKMAVRPGAEPQITRSAGRVPHWNVLTDLDLSALESITPDDAVTRFRYVIRNLALGGTNRTTLLMVATHWRGTERMTDKSRTGQLLTARAPAAGAGWP